MPYEWDSANIDHIARHNITPEDVEEVLENEPIDLGGVLRNGEQRSPHLGETDAGRVLFVVVTERNGMLRPVMARPARRKERAFYSKYKAVTNGSETTNPGNA